MRAGEAPEEVRAVREDVVEANVFVNWRGLVEVHSILRAVGFWRQAGFWTAFVAFPRLLEVTSEVFAHETDILFNVVDDLGVLMQVEVADGDDFFE